MTIFFRKFPNNILTIPVLINSLENLFGHNDLNCFHFFSLEELAKISAFSDKTFYIAYSFMTTEAEKVYSEIKQIRASLKNRKYLILGGGPHINGDDKNYFGFDYVFSGYGEESFPYFLKDVKNNSNEFVNKKYLIKDRTVTPCDTPDLNKSFPFNEFFNTSPPLEIMRGCRQRCNFCQTGALSKNKFQIRSMGSIEKYLIHSKNKTFQRINFISPNAFDFKLPGRTAFESVEYLLSICAGYKFKYIEYGIFPSEVRPESVNTENISLIKKYCANKKVTIGGQSGNNKILRSINRKHSVEDIIRASQIIYDAGLIPNIDFIIGFPEESRQDRIELISLVKMLAKKFRAKIQMHYFIPLSGTKYYLLDPSTIDPETKNDLDKLTEGGVILSWWKNGVRLSEQVVKFRNFINISV